MPARVRRVAAGRRLGRRISFTQAEGERGAVEGREVVIREEKLGVQTEEGQQANKRAARDITSGGEGFWLFGGMLIVCRQFAFSPKQTTEKVRKSTRFSARSSRR